MIYSYEIKKLKDIVRKKDVEPWGSLLFWRRLSIYITWFCTKISIPAYIISLISLIFFIASIICFLFNGTVISFIGVFSLNFYRVLDHVDGELDRYEVKILKKTPTLLRKYLDLVSHKFSPAVYFAIGCAVDKEMGSNIFSLLGFLSGFFISGIANEPAKLLLTQAIFINPLLIKEIDPKIINKVYIRSFRNIDSYHTKKKLLLYLLNIRSIFISPGSMTIISIIVVIDSFLTSPVLYGYSIPYRGLFLIFATPLYLINMMLSIPWHSSLMSSIKL